ncbi:MAG: cyclopropane fatty acyl phospholipid synthase [Steroidobacteraceae bacterium]
MPPADEVTDHLFKTLFENLLDGTGVALDGGRPWDIRVNRRRLYRRALRGSLGIGEAYIDGDWDCDALDELFRRVLSSNKLNSPLIRAARGFKVLQSRLVNLQTRGRSRAVAEEHYDIDHRMYALFLGPWNQYTCCFFDGTGDLEQAEVIKLEMLCDKLELKRGDRLLDIGCGWGGFAKYAASTRGCEVTGISLSEEQIRYATAYTRGLPVAIRRLDYRDLPDSGLGPFDKISIVGMIEHVGYKNYAELMRVVHESLKPDGLFLLHTIGNCERTTVVDPWMEKYIFRNSMAPAMGQLADAAEGRFVIEDWENYGHHYVPTLQAWYERFNANWDRIRALKTARPFDERFRRMWNYYLMASKAAFDVEQLHLWQLVMTRRNSGRGVYRRVMQGSAQPVPRELARSAR